MEVNFIEFPMRHYVISLLHNCQKMFCNFKDNSEIQDYYEFQCILSIYFIIIRIETLLLLLLEYIFEKTSIRNLRNIFHSTKVEISQQTVKNNSEILNCHCANTVLSDRKLSHAQEPNETFSIFTIFIYNRLAGGSAGRIKRKSDTNLH